jgi:hypothetical protein
VYRSLEEQEEEKKIKKNKKSEAWIRYADKGIDIGAYT